MVLQTLELMKTTCGFSLIVFIKSIILFSGRESDLFYKLNLCTIGYLSLIHEFSMLLNLLIAVIN